MKRMVRQAWGVMTYGPFILLLIGMIGFIMLFRHAGDGFYRYPCQDPALWSDPQCRKPACDSTGTCTDYLINREMIDEG
jgi:hypothetical protein